MESSYLYDFVGIGGPWVEFLRFLPRVGNKEFQITNSSVQELF